MTIKEDNIIMYCSLKNVYVCVEFYVLKINKINQFNMFLVRRHKVLAITKLFSTEVLWVSYKSYHWGFEFICHENKKVVYEMNVFLTIYNRIQK